MNTLTNRIDDKDTINFLKNFSLSPIPELVVGSICTGHHDLGYVFSTIEEGNREVLSPLTISARRVFADYNNDDELTIFTSLDAEDF